MQYLADSWHVYAACRQPRSAEKLQRRARDEKHRLDILAMDVTNSSSIKRAAARIRHATIDVLINSAGITGKPGQKIGNVDYGSWAQVLDVNTRGPLRVTEALVDHVARSERKLIVTITSGMGSIADNTSGGSIAYRSSKAAVNMVRRSTAIDLAPRGISCLLVNPGWVRTDMGGGGAPLSAHESVTALRRLIEKCGPSQSMKFLTTTDRSIPGNYAGGAPV